MSPAVQPWSRTRWLAVAGGLALLHAGLFRYLARFPAGPTLASPWPGPVMRLTSATPPADPATGVSPTRFALPDDAGFSGDAARHLPRAEYEVAGPPPRPSFLPADPEAGHLGRPPGFSGIPLPSATRVPEAGAGELAGPVVSPDGLVEIHPAGGFPASRRLAPAPLWGGEGPGQATRIEFCVNPLGEIVAARVVRSSGSRPADAAALATVRECRFEPVAGARAADRLRPDALRWTLATVHPAIPTPTTTTTPATR